MRPVLSMPIRRALMIVVLAIVAPVLFWTGCEQPTEVRTEIRTEVDTLRVTVTDTLTMTDTLAVTDTLVVTDTLIVTVTDTLPVLPFGQITISGQTPNYKGVRATLWWSDGIPADLSFTVDVEGHPDGNPPMEQWVGNDYITVWNDTEWQNNNAWVVVQFNLYRPEWQDTIRIRTYACWKGQPTNDCPQL